MRGIMRPVALFAALGAAGCGGNPAPPPPEPQATRVFDLAVRNHPFAGPVAEAEADRILTDATRVLNTADGTGDVACRVLLQRTGPVLPLDRSLPAEVNSAEDFDRLVAEPGRVKVVRRIRWCGSPADNVIGCAPKPGLSLVVVRHSRDLEGQLLAHEFGHNRGLDHVGDPARVMYFAIEPGARRVDAAECGRYTGPEPAVQAAALAGPPRPDIRTLRSDVAATEIERFVRQVWPHGFPLTAARRFSPAEVERVLPLLDSDAERRAWANIVLVAGAAGGPGTAERLLAFLNHPVADPSDPAAVSAKTSVPVALGYLANRTGDPLALRTLIDGTRPAQWQALTARLARTPDEAEGLRQDLVNQSITGLSLSGRPEAMRRLQDLQRAPRAALAPGAAPAAAAQQQRFLDQALDTARRAQSGGLDAVRP